MNIILYFNKEHFNDSKIKLYCNHYKFKSDEEYLKRANEFNNNYHKVKPNELIIENYTRSDKKVTSIKSIIIQIILVNMI